MVSIVQSVCMLALIFSLLEGRHFNSTDAQPIFKDPDLGVESIVEEGLSSPTSMAFIGNNSILVLEKNSGTSCFKWCIARRASYEVRC